MGGIQDGFAKIFQGISEGTEKGKKRGSIYSRLFPVKLSVLYLDLSACWFVVFAIFPLWLHGFATLTPSKMQVSAELKQ